MRVRDLLVIAAQRLAQADVPDDVAAGLRLGRMVALLKPSGGIRALVMGDVFRRLVSRTLAQQFSTPLQEACAPYQYALSTRAGAEALERALRVATDMSTSTTVVSVDGVGAYDHISRKCMFDGLLASPALVPLVPLVRLFYGGDSEYLFYDASGAAHAVLQSEGGEQGDPLMPGLFAVGIHQALRAAHASFQPGEDLLAFLDDTYISCLAERAAPTFRALREALAAHANIDLHLGKTKVWNSGGVEPVGFTDEVPADPDRPPAWVGDWTLPAEQQGMVVLGTPLGSHAFVAAHLQSKLEAHKILLSKLPSVPDLQVAWLLFLMCAAPRCHYLLRALPPAYTATFAHQHDEAVLACLQDLLANGGPPTWDANATRRAQLPLQLGGLGLRSAETTRFAAHWACWADTVPTRHPDVLAVSLRQAEAFRSEPRAGCIVPNVSTALHAESCLRQAGFDAPCWPALLDNRPPSGQARALTVLPTAPEFRMPSDCMRVLLLRRLRLPLPHTPRRCRCGGTLDALGDQRAACPTACVLGPRGAPLERAAAGVCREGGARVATARHERRRAAGGLAGGPPPHRGAGERPAAVARRPGGCRHDLSARLAGTAQRGRARTMCRAKRRQTRHAGNATPHTRSCWPPVSVAWWCWRLRWADALVPKWRIFSAAWPPPKRGRRCRGFGLQPARRRATVGQACWLLPRSGLSPCHSLSCRWTGQTSVTGRSRRWQTCWRTRAMYILWLKAACRYAPERRRPQLVGYSCFSRPWTNSREEKFEKKKKGCRKSWQVMRVASRAVWG